MVFCACGSLMEFGHILRERVLDTMTNLNQQWLAPHRKPSGDKPGFANKPPCGVSYNNINVLPQRGHQCSSHLHSGFYSVYRPVGQCVVRHMMVNDSNARRESHSRKGIRDIHHQQLEE